MTTKRWIGSAVAIPDLWTISLSGTVISQTYSITINGKTISYVAGGSDTATVILAALTAAWNLATAPAEIQELTAAAFTSTMTLTGDTAGKPSAVSVATTGGATFTITNTTPATGPNDFANALNWAGGVVPANSDTIIFDNGSVPCKYGINTSLTGIVLIILPGYSGTIGLPFLNTDNAVLQYAEYRTLGLTFVGGTATINSLNLKQCNLAFGANTANVTVLSSAPLLSRLNKQVPCVLITGGNGSSTLTITRGDVGLAFYESQTATFATISTSYQTNPITDVSLFCGDGTTLTTVNMNGGSVTTNSNVTTFTQGIGGGTSQITSGAVTTLNLEGGTCVYSSTGTLGTANVSGTGFLDFGQSPVAKTVTNPISLSGDDSFINDPLKTVNSSTLSFTTTGTQKFNVNHGGGSVNTSA